MDTSLIAKKDESLLIPMSGEQKEQLRQYAETRGISMAMAVRVILSDVLTRDLQNKQVTSKVRKAS